VHATSTPYERVEERNSSVGVDAINWKIAANWSATDRSDASSDVARIPAALRNLRTVGAVDQSHREILRTQAPAGGVLLRINEAREVHNRISA
jgi:hypothetical protein